MKPKNEDLIGVVICDCGGEIARRLDTESLRREAAALPGVAYAAREAYPCSKDGQARLRQAIRDHPLDRVLIAGCAPRLVERLFRQAAELDGGRVEVADIREQCAFVHADRETATRKAADLIEMGVARLAATEPRPAPVGRVVRAALVIGGGLGGLAIAQSLAENGVDVTLVEAGGALGEAQPDRDERARQLVAERVEAAERHRRIRILLNARVSDVCGRPGDYEAHVVSDKKATTLAVGAIVVAAGAQSKRMGSDRWYDRSRVKTQAEFETELDNPATAALDDVVMILCASGAGDGRCSRVCCLAGVRQAIRARQIHPRANVTVLFRDLYLGGSGDLHADELECARKLGVTFFRYSKDQPPAIGDKTVDVPDALTGEPLRLPFDRVVLAMPIDPPEAAGALAALLRVPRDEHGFLIEPRARLRPGRYADDGVFVLGGAHQPADTAETLFQAHVTGARVTRFLSQDEIRSEAPIAEVDAALCTGCANCAPVCPTAAITLQKREGVLSLAQVEALRCTGCGNCAVACPVKAIDLPGWEDAAILAQISAALRTRGDGQPAPRVVALACEWSAYAAAEVAGARRLSYPAEVRTIRMPCSARFDPNHILWAFINGADGVLLGACPPGECHYGDGNRYARERVEALQRQLAERGIDPRRLHLALVPGDDGEGFARAMKDFLESVISYQ
jgi:heterodisulfide reductase subunit A